MNEFNVIEYLTARSVKMPLSEGGCWLWQAYMNPDGYGVFTHKRKNHYVHRAVMEAHGHNLDGMCVDHLCGNRNCWNPLHLEVVTREENGIRRADERWHAFRRYALQDQPGALNGRVVKPEADAA